MTVTPGSTPPEYQSTAPLNVASCCARARPASTRSRNTIISRVRVRVTIGIVRFSFLRIAMSKAETMRARTRGKRGFRKEIARLTIARSSPHDDPQLESPQACMFREVTRQECGTRRALASACANRARRNANRARSRVRSLVRRHPRPTNLSGDWWLDSFVRRHDPWIASTRRPAFRSLVGIHVPCRFSSARLGLVQPDARRTHAGAASADGTRFARPPHAHCRTHGLGQDAGGISHRD